VARVILASPFHEESRPLLSTHLTTLTSSTLDLTVVADDTAYSFRDRSAVVLSQVWPYLDGKREMAAISLDCGIPWDEISAVLAPLTQDGWAIDDRAVYEAEAAEQFFEAYRDLCEFWKKDIFTRPFWTELASGQAPRNVVLGWLIEFYHYIEAANEHMPASVAQCRTDETIQLWLARHYAEEYDHSQMFLDGLVEAGLDRDRLRDALPLASTRALINYIKEVASSDTVAYAAMHGIFQAPGSTESWRAVERFFEFLLAHYDFGGPVLRAFRQHASLDAELGHDDLVFRRICERAGTFPRDRIQSILNCTRGLVDHFVLFFDGIHDFYSDPDAPLPRRRLDIRAL
jgi:pyrroloquinoline quinone (PQQ) biosynthesis protein C